jgi:hypothetical protein
VKDGSHILPAFPLERSCEGQAARPISIAYLDRIRYCLGFGVAAPSAGVASTRNQHADNLSITVMYGIPIIQSQSDTYQ